MKVVLAVLLFAALVNGLELVNGKVKITTITTSGCGDTINFITTQLVPTYAKYRDFLDIEFIPWGRTRRNPDGSISCQFGPADCRANRIQRCALDLLKDNQDSQVSYMNCEFTSPFPSFKHNSYNCAQAVGLDTVEVDRCVSTSEGDLLDSGAEAAAQRPMAVINFVPAIVFNDQIDVTFLNQARSNLKSVVCSALACEPYTRVSDCSS